MKVLVYGINFSPELTGIGKYTGEMVEWMTDHGVDVHVITAPPYYPEWKISKGYSSIRYKLENTRYPIYRCPLYVPREKSTVKRILHLLSFSFTSFFSLLKQTSWKPDYIICIAPTMFCFPGSYFLKKITSSKLMLHIQDYEVDAMLGLGMTKHKQLGLMASAFERWCLRKADIVSTISNSMVDKAVSKGVSKDRILYFPNWSEVERFRNVTEGAIDKIASILGVSRTKKIVLYSGNIGEKQGLEIILEVAKMMQSNVNIIFLIVGDGLGKHELEKRCYSLGITNILFRPLQPYEYLPALLKLADCHLVIQRRGAADSVLPSKLTNILAVGGNSVITADPDTELGKLCSLYPGIAINVEPESASALASGITESLNLNRENEVASRYAETNLNKNSILGKLIDSLNSNI
ncbi:glycosyltransferase WbuB [Raoultella planticola]|uniref:glycosyltransferase WbuB n=1 Tax=Raoultella planticola TaxID=575 RepID=UPI00051635E5|nr:glycosyltransferase WbuB [Raoultella planticola]